MYQVVIKMWVDGERQKDSVYVKSYAKRGFAERKAREYMGEYDTKEHHVKREAYVRRVLKMVTVEEAKRAYRRGYYVYIDTEYGKERLASSGWYGSHASSEELFYRSVDTLIGWWKHGDTNYYVEF